MGNLKTYLQDPFLNRIYQEIRSAGSLKSISLDITNVCNLRCKGCYYFEEGMDQVQSSSEDDFEQFIQLELERGTNFVTIVGGEPSLEIGRIRKIYKHFKTNVATNGLIQIPYDGLEELPIGISIWGKRETDSALRSNGKRDLFAIAKQNYKNDPRAFWYYTVAPGYAHEIEQVVSECISNGNKVLFNYYSDLAGLGGGLDYKSGFNEVRSEIDRMIDLYPGKILMTPYFNQVISTGELLGEKWGYQVCTNLSTDYSGNFERFENGNLYNTHFRAYNADFSSTRRCCTGISRDCNSCFDTWEHFSWVMINLRKHLNTKESFTDWLTTMYLFYYINKMVDNQAISLSEVQAYLKAAASKTIQQTA